MNFTSKCTCSKNLAAGWPFGKYLIEQESIREIECLVAGQIYLYVAHRVDHIRKFVSEWIMFYNIAEALKLGANMETPLLFCRKYIVNLCIESGLFLSENCRTGSKTSWFYSRIVYTDLIYTIDPISID